MKLRRPFWFFVTSLCLGILLMGNATDSLAQDDWQEGIGLWVVRNADGKPHEYSYARENDYRLAYEYERVGNSRWKIVVPHKNIVRHFLEVRNTADYAIACTSQLNKSADVNLGWYKKYKQWNGKYPTFGNRGVIGLPEKYGIEQGIKYLRVPLKSGPVYRVDDYGTAPEITKEYPRYVVLWPGESFVLENDVRRKKGFFSKDEWVEVNACISLKKDAFFD